MKPLIIGIISIMTLLAVIFAGLNTGAVTLDYYFGQTELSLAVLVVISLCSGALLGVFASFSTIIRFKNANKGMKKDIQLLEEEVYNLRRLPLRDVN